MTTTRHWVKFRGIIAAAGLCSAAVSADLTPATATSMTESWNSQE